MMMIANVFFRELDLSSNGDSHIPTLRSTPYGVPGQGERAAYESGYVNGRLRHYQVRQRMPYSSEENLDDEAEHGGRQVSPGRRYGDIMSTELPFSQDYRRVDSGYPSTSPVSCLFIYQNFTVTLLAKIEENKSNVFRGT